MEFWKDISGYENYYQISNYGNVRSLDRVICNGLGGKMKVKGMIIEPRRGTYLSIGLTKQGKKKTFLVHRLVAVTFLPNPNKLPYVNHIDGNKFNNCDDNLEWSSETHNANHAYDMGLAHSGSKSHYAKIDERTVAEIIYLNETTSLTYSLIGKMYGLCSESISNMCRRKSWNRPIVRNAINEHLQKLKQGLALVTVDISTVIVKGKNFRRRSEKRYQK